MAFFQNLFTRKSSPPPDKGLGALTYRSDSSRVVISKTASGLDIAIKWLSSEKLAIQFLQADQKVRITYPSIFKDPAELPASLDVSSFLNQPELPVPYASPEYSKQLEASKDRHKALSVVWISLLLIHPAAGVVLDTLKSQKDFSTLGILDDLAGLLVCGSKEVQNEVAKVLWQQGDSSLDFIFNILANRGILPAGILSEEGTQAALVLRANCPTARKDYFTKKALDFFGPTVAGVKVETKKPNVKFKTRYTKTISSPFGHNIGTYEVYTAPSKKEARVFLESYKITKDYFYVEIETPEGPVGKDKMGIY